MHSSFWKKYKVFLLSWITFLYSEACIIFKDSAFRMDQGMRYRCTFIQETLQFGQKTFIISIKKQRAVLISVWTPGDGGFVSLYRWCKVFITKHEDVLRRTFPEMDNTGHKSQSYTCPYRREVRGWWTETPLQRRTSVEHCSMSTLTSSREHGTQQTLISSEPKWDWHIKDNSVLMISSKSTALSFKDKQDRQPHTHQRGPSLPIHWSPWESWHRSV